MNFGLLGAHSHPRYLPLSSQLRHTESAEILVGSIAPTFLYFSFPFVSALQVLNCLTDLNLH